jgi:hypothetical protein
MNSASKDPDVTMAALLVATTQDEAACACGAVCDCGADCKCQPASTCAPACQCAD